MSEVAEIYSTIRRMSRKKRSKNRDWSTNKLIDLGVKFSKHNNGVHLIVNHNGVTVDFWPGTGKWITRDGFKGRGVYNMLDHIGVTYE